MSIETRDFVIERLEKQLIEKDREFEEIKTTLRDSILRELRRDLQNDLDLNNRIINLEQKLLELTNNVNGIMDELLDQKTVLRSANRLLGYGGDNVTAKEQVTPAAQQTTPFPKRPASRAPVREGSVDSAARVQPTNARFNVRDTKQEPEPVSSAPGAKSEYIIADNNDETSVRITPRLQKNSRNEYIVAEDEKTLRKPSHNPSRTFSRTSSQTEEHEDVENRDDEDVVITTSRKKPDI